MIRPNFPKAAFFPNLWPDALTTERFRTTVLIASHGPGRADRGRPGRSVGYDPAGTLPGSRNPHWPWPPHFSACLCDRTSPSDALVGDVRHREPRPLGAERPRRLPPAVRPHAQLLTQQRHEDLRLLRAEPGQRRHPASAARRPVPADSQSRAASPSYSSTISRAISCTGRHRPGVAVQGGPFGEDRGQPVRVELGQLGRGGLVAQARGPGPSGALNAFSSVTCWSSSMAMSRASGLRLSSSLASGPTGIPDRHGAPSQGSVLPQRTPSAL